MCQSLLWNPTDLNHRRHIITHHGRKPRHHQCRRCKDQFDTETELEEHLLLPRDQICEVNPRTLDDPEDGITDGIANILAARGATEETQTWEGIWRTLFPSDPEVPEPGVLRPLPAADITSLPPNRPAPGD